MARVEEVELDLTVKERLTGAIEIVKSLRAMYSSPERAIVKLKLNCIKECSKRAYTTGFSPEEVQLLYTLVKA